MTPELIIGNGLVRCCMLTAVLQIAFTLPAMKERSSFFSMRARIMSLANLFLVAGLLGWVLYLFIANRFDYYQVWSHSAADLPLFFRIAALWEGQEGSFLLWAFIQAVITYLLMRKPGRLRLLAGGISVLIQLFLLLPLVPWYRAEADVSLFSRTVSALHIPAGSLRASWTLANGAGMNPILRNFWMTVHPPVIFLAFAVSSAPYALAVAGLYLGDRSWPAAAGRWLKYSTAILTTGILMGAWWAYETLNFGGYWSWDPVENAVYLPWLISVATLHINWLAIKYPRYTRPAVAFNSLCFMAVVYATFLTRSGLLGDTSVHAFTGSGYGPLLSVFLAVVTLLPVCAALLKMDRPQALAMAAAPALKGNRPLMVAAVLTLAAFQVFVYTSWPVVATALGAWGLDLDIAPPATADPYSRWQGFFALVLLTILFITEGTGSRAKVKLQVIVPWALACLLLLLALAVFSLNKSIAFTLALVNISVFVVLIRKGFYALAGRNVSGSLIAHTGFAFLLAGILCSHNLLYRGAPALPQHHVLAYAKATNIDDQPYTYEGRYLRDAHGSMISAHSVMPLPRAGHFMARRQIEAGPRTYRPGDVLEIKNHDRYYRICKGPPGNPVRFFAHVYFKDPASYYITPCIDRTWLKDTYLHISNLRDDSKLTWHDSLTFHFAGGHNRQARLLEARPLKRVPGMHIPTGAQAWMLSVAVEHNDGRQLFTPIVITGPDKEAFRCIPDLNTRYGARMEVSAWQDTRTFSLALLRANGDDWITVQVASRPLINLFWLGGLLMAAGILLSLKKKRPAGGGREHKRKVKVPSARNRISKKSVYADN